MRILLVLLALTAATAARAATTEEALLHSLQSSSNPIDRARACAALAREPKRGPRVSPALVAAMNRDLSDRVRLAAAEAVITFTEDDASRLATAFLQSEPGAEIRAQMLLALSTEPAHLQDTDVTRTIASLLAEDPSPEVRRTAALALSRRGDHSALPAVRRAAASDVAKTVREAARQALAVLSVPPKAAARPAPPKPTPPRPDAIKGRDPCPAPWAWCECSGIIRREPKCLTRSECHALYNGVLQSGMACTWSGIDLEQDLEGNGAENLPSP